MAEFFYDRIHNYLKFIRIVGGFPYTWNSDEGKFKLKAKTSETLKFYSLIVSVLFYFYVGLVFFQVLEIKHRYSSNGTLVLAFLSYAVIRASMTIFIHIGRMSLYSRHLLKDFAKQALQLSAMCANTKQVPRKHMISLFKTVSVVTCLAPWVYMYYMEPIISFTSAIIVFDICFGLLFCIRYLSLLLAASALIKQCLLECFQPFLDDKNYCCQQDRRKIVLVKADFVTKEDFMICMKRYEKIDRFVKTTMDYFSYMIILTVGLKMCGIIVTSYCLTQLYGTADFYIFLSLDFNGILIAFYSLNSMMPSTDQVSCLYF